MVRNASVVLGCNQILPLPPMSALKKLVSDTAIYGLPSILGRFLNYLLVPLYTRNLVPAEYGVVTEMYAYVAFLGVLLTYGMETAFFRFYNSEENKQKVFSTAMASLLATSFIFIGLIFLLKWPLANFLGMHSNPEMIDRYADYLLWFVFIISIDAVTAVPFARLRALNRPIKFAIIKLLGIFANVSLNLFFILGIPFMLQHHIAEEFVQSISQFNLVRCIFIINLFSSAVTLVLLIPESVFSLKDADKALLRRMLVYGLPILVMGLAGMVNETFDRIMLKYLLPLSPERTMHEVGVYGACYKLSIIMTLCIQAFKYAAEPFFFARHRQDDNRKIYADVMTYFVLGCSLVFLGTMLYMDLIQYFIGNKDSEYLEGLAIVPILLLANMCLGIYYNLSIWFKLTDRTRAGAIISIFGAVLTLVLNYLLIPIMGYMGAAYTTLICYAAMMIMSWAWGQRCFPVPYELLKIAFFILLAVLIYLLSLHIESNGLIEKLAINSILIIVYAGLAYGVVRIRAKSSLS